MRGSSVHVAITGVSHVRAPTLPHARNTARTPATTTLFISSNSLSARPCSRLAPTALPPGADNALQPSAARNDLGPGSYVPPPPLSNHPSLPPFFPSRALDVPSRGGTLSPVKRSSTPESRIPTPRAGPQTRPASLSPWGALLALALATSSARAETRFVSPDGLHIPPFTNWSSAATNFPDALSACAPGDVVVASNGAYSLSSTLRVTNHVTLLSAFGRDATLLDAGALPAGQDAVFLLFGALDGFTVSNAPRHGVKCESGAILNCLVTHSRSNGIDCYTSPRIVTNSLLLVSNTLVRHSASNGIYTCAVDSRIENCLVTGSGASGVSLRQNDTVAPIQIPRVSNFLLRASTISSNLNSGVKSAFWYYNAALPDVPVLIEDCRIEDNVGVLGGGVSDGAGEYTTPSGVHITKSIIRRNRASVGAGGVYFLANRSPSIRCSFVEDNDTPGNGGGIAMEGGSMFNCLVRGNLSDAYGGGASVAAKGILCNNTIVYNTAKNGGGASGGQIRNCVLFYNHATENKNINGGSVTYSCSTPWVSGLGNISSPPGLSGFRNWRLVPGSPCIDAGNFSFAEDDYDLEGDPRIWGGGVDMGCDEFYPPALGGPLSVEVNASADRAVVGTPISFQCDVEGRPESYAWLFSDGHAVSNTPYVDRSFDSPGTFSVTVTARNPDGSASNSLSFEIFPGYTNFVSPAGRHVFPFTNQLDAATNIQDAISANIPGGVVRVDDGTYAAGGVAWRGALPSRVALTNVLDVVSVNGPGSTLIVGQGPIGDGAIRCAYVASGARLIGFTLTNGHTRASGDADLDQSGGGAWCESDGSLENCVIRNNVAAQLGGGARNGRLIGSTLRDNSALDGGGASGSSALRCVVSNNLATGQGGGLQGGTNENVLVVDNQAAYGGGLAEAVLSHATVSRNHAQLSGGGAYRSDIRNSILYFNTADASWPNYFNSICRHCCTTPDPQSIGNVTNDPLFTEASAGNFRLRGDSTAVDSAETSDLAIDLLGAPRPLPGTPDGVPAPDMGAYEYTAAHYVAPGGGHVWPFLSWTDAAHDLQSAIDAADPLDAVFASNGVYASGGRPRSGASLTNRALIDKPIRVVAVNGPASTAIVGQGPIGAAAVRAVFLASNAALSGFTVRNGATLATDDEETERSGGGIWAEPGAAISNCVVASNSASAFGGGAFGGHLVNSFLHANAAAQGGGLARAQLEFCTVSGNAATLGGGASDSTGRSCILYFNSASIDGPNTLGGAWETSCTTPDPGGLGNLTNDPAFLSPGEAPLAAGSPCIDAAPEAAPFPTVDLDSVPRPLDGDGDGTARPDLGAQEFIHPSADTDGDGLSDLDELATFRTDPLRQDPDGDGQSDLAETIAGMDPFDPASVFAILDASLSTDGQLFSWPGRAGRLYTIVSMDGAAPAPTNFPAYVDQPGTDGDMSFTNPSPDRLHLYGVRVRLAP